MSENVNRNRRRWGIIYVPKAGSLRPMKRWKEIREYLAEKGVEYDCIQSENYDSIERHAKMLADNGYETIVVVGGDGVLQDAINGIMSSKNHAAVALGIVPCGIANDYASYWGLADGDYKNAINCIMTRRVRKVDLGCCIYSSEGIENKRYFLNVLNIGVSAHIVELANKKRTLFANLAYRVLGFFHLLFSRQSYRMKFRLNCQTVDKKFMMLFIGNARGYGMTPSAVPYNGWLDVSAIRMPKFLGILEGMHMLMRRRILNFKLVEPFRTTDILIEDLGGAGVGIDGRPFKFELPFRVIVEPELLNLIIPSKINKKS
ncbi:MAG: lipid kinase [Bacteroidaceae bacterium]|nr:lipid kinase [Bacteroidaceae bacterium]